MHCYTTVIRITTSRVSRGGGDKFLRRASRKKKKTIYGRIRFPRKLWFQSSKTQKFVGFRNYLSTLNELLKIVETIEEDNNSAMGPTLLKHTISLQIF